MDVATSQLVNTVVNELAASGKMFSAWDVTRIVRARGAARGFHNEIRDEVRNVFSNTTLSSNQGYNYTRSGHTIGNNIPVMVYHPTNEDFTSYDPDALDPAKQTAGVTKAVAAVMAVAAPACCSGSGCSVDDGADDEDSDDDVTDGSSITLDRQGDDQFIRIPAAYMRAIGASAGNTVSVETRNNKVIVSIPVAPNGNQQKTDARNNLRIYDRTLNAAGIDFDGVVTVVGQTLTVE